MHITLVIVSIVFLVFRLIYFELAVGRTKAEAFLNAVSRIQSIKYFFPLKYSDSDTPRIRNLKSIANMFLYCLLPNISNANDPGACRIYI